jgi:pimeloyl-ACP methyl ester carboxylesterase
MPSQGHGATATGDRYFDSAGVALRYVEAGHGEPVVLLHSFCGNLERDFVRSGLFAALAEHYRVIALDLRGHGKSGKPHDPSQYGREMALDVVRLLDHLRLPTVHIVGYSLGAHVTAQSMSLHPSRFITATLGGAPGRRHWTEDEDRRIAIEAAELDQRVLRTQILRLWPQSAPPPSEADIAARTEAYLRGNDAKALAALRRANRDQVVGDAALAASGVRTLGIVGSRDAYRDEFHTLAAAMPQLTLVEIEGAAHDEALGKAEFRDALLAFLESNSRDP